VETGWLFSEKAQAEGLFVAQNLPLLLWSGLAVLTLALLILMRTRWGQAKPLSKCVVLSVFAHILFVAYAYGTRLIFDHPHAQAEIPIRLAMVDTDADSRQPETLPSEQVPWDNFATENGASPSISSPRPQSAEISLPRDSQFVSEPDFDAQLQPEQLQLDEPPRPVPDAPSELRSPADAAPSEVEIESPPVEPPQRVEPLAPVESALPRQVTETPAAMTPAEIRRTAPGELFDEASQIQRLSDLPVTDERSEAIRDQTENTNASDNRFADATGAGRTGINQREGDIPESASPQPAREVGGYRRLGDGALLPELYQLRATEQRDEVAGRYGGNLETEAAVEAALDWLAAHQHEDGRWDASEFGAGHEMRVLGHDRQGVGAEADTGITGLALLALLGAGQTHFEGKYGRNIQHGLEYLLQKQQSDGSLAGDARLFARMYCHGIASLAVSEAYAMTGDYRLQPYTQRAIEYTVRAQHPTTGGWRYQPGDRGDMSQFGWQVMALKSAELAGIKIPGEARAGMLRFLNEVSSGTHGGLASYRRGEQASQTMTAESLACRLFLGQPTNTARHQEAASFLLRQRPGAGPVNLYYWYYATLSLFQLQGDSWQQWNDSLQPELLRLQRKQGDEAGSWDPNTVWGGYGGRVYSTAMAALCLEVYYRYLPLYAE